MNMILSKVVIGLAAVLMLGAANVWAGESAASLIERGNALYEQALEEDSEKLYAQAAKLFKQAAEMGNIEGQLKLGELYRDGVGVEENYSEAAKWYRIAAAQGSYDAEISLGNLYFEQLHDRAEAVRWFMKAAKFDPPGAYSGLAYLYEREGNRAEAIKWYRNAFESGFSNSDLDKLIELGVDRKSLCAGRERVCKPHDDFYGPY